MKNFVAFLIMAIVVLAGVSGCATQPKHFLGLENPSSMVMKNGVSINSRHDSDLEILRNQGWKDVETSCIIDRHEKDTKLLIVQCATRVSGQHIIGTPPSTIDPKFFNQATIDKLVEDLNNDDFVKDKHQREKELTKTN